MGLLGDGLGCHLTGHTMDKGVGTAEFIGTSLALMELTDFPTRYQQGQGSWELVMAWHDDADTCLLFVCDASNVTFSLISKQFKIPHKSCWRSQSNKIKGVEPGL